MNQVYEIKNTLVLYSLEEWFSRNRTNGVISLETAAVVWGFSNLVINNYDITFRKGSVSKKNDWNIIQHQKVDRFYYLGLIEIEFNHRTYRIYDPERTIVDIVKEHIGKIDNITSNTIKKFFKEINYDVDKLLLYAKELKVENELRILIGVIHD